MIINLNKLFQEIDKTILANSDIFLLNEDEKNSIYKFKCFIDEELAQRTKTKKARARININFKGVK